MKTANTVATVAEMTAELGMLDGAIELQGAEIDRLVMAADAAAERFEATFGFHPSMASDHAPSWASLRADAERLSDENGYFWAMSRARDLRVALGMNASGQRPIVLPTTCRGCDFEVVGIGPMPRRDPSVLLWLVRRVFGAETILENVSFAWAA